MVLFHYNHVHIFACITIFLYKYTKSTSVAFLASALQLQAVIITAVSTASSWWVCVWGGGVKANCVTPAPLCGHLLHVMTASPSAQQ